jgi:predicted transcriptional regulator
MLVESGNGAVAYYLHRLEREGLIYAKREGLYKRYYPKEKKMVRKRPSQKREVKRRQVTQERKKPPSKREKEEKAELIDDWDILRGSFKVPERISDEFIE